ncbi:polyadenylate-binding protein-interacting protein 2B [Frankliniella occidentalis]|uniref:Polyadenylate-binding protein-interacting protein 2B n=1 Tax=Frankliniella occidentalis TaxID=133901 RepID=A0A6J1STF4_FRAOC|nr:polyadenylate-binding protein-interacting protein 2B [Frankliniella occidentalis]
MKLPTETSAPPSNAGSGNGYYGQNNVMLILAPPSPDPAENGDFSEYFWMENEEEFDQQVLKELEEEALMEQCMQAMIDDTSPMNSPASWQQNSTPSYLPEVQNLPGSDIVMAMRGLQVNEMGNGTEDHKNQPKSEFKFNPMAKEFIPGMSWYPGVQCNDRSPRISELVDNQPDA